jgi:phenylalanyl-tRNA synthetase beta chain
MLALGYNEAVSPTFISSADANAFSGATLVPLANPLSEEQSVMRTSLVAGMLGMLAWNLNRGTSDVRLFEIGHVFSAPSEESVKETPVLCIGATGRSTDPNVHGPARPYSFFDLKGDIEALLGAFDIGQLRFEPATGCYHPGRSARVLADGMVVGGFGQLHPGVAAARKFRQDVYLAEIYLDQLFAFPLRAPRYRELSRFPAVDRDFSFTFPDSVDFENIGSAVRELNIAQMQSFRPVEIFRGGAVPAGKYSVLLRAEFQSAERTLRDDEVGQWSGRIIAALAKIGGSLRS